MTIKVKRFDLREKIEGYGIEVSKIMKREIMSATLDIADEARKRFPEKVNGVKHFELAKMRQSIGHEFRGEGTGIIFIQVDDPPMAAYIEFGTGGFVNVPAGYEDMAWQFYVNGKGTLPPYPYLIPSYEKGKKKFIEDLKNKLKDL